MGRCDYLSVYCNYCNWNKPSFFDLFIQTFFSGFCITKKPIKCRRCNKLFYIKDNGKNMALGICSWSAIALLPKFSNLLYFFRVEKIEEWIYFICLAIYICLLYCLMEIIKNLLLIKFGEFTLSP